MLEVINVSSNIIRKAAIKKILLFFICGSMISLTANAQNFDLKDYLITINGETLENAFTGGFTAPQLAAIDLDMNGVLDLLVFDRRGNVARTFMHDGVAGSTNYTFAPKYQVGLPPMQNFMRVADYNQDGIPDIFTGPTETSGSVAVYTGSWNGDRLQFDIYEVSNYQYDVLTVLTNGAPTNIYVAPNDTPAIADIDFDGDIDILSFEVGGSYVYYYKNVAVEKGLGLDTFDFVLEDTCWGKFQEGGFDGSIATSDTHVACGSFFTNQPTISSGDRHAGSTLEVIDYQCDGDYDLLVGDLLGENVVLLINDPVGDVAYVENYEFNFPLEDPVELYVFPSTWVLDLNHDGDLDFVACPNEDSNALNYANFQYYENTGDGCNVTFEKQQDDFLVNTTVDLGTDSNPSFLDFNADGLIDLLVGTTGVFGPTGQEEKIGLMLFENVGDAQNPKYNLVDNDWLSFSINTMTSINPATTIGDLDGDGDEDLIIGDSQGKLYYLENTAGAGNPMEFAQAVFEYMDIDVGQLVEPYIYDYNGDGLGDLFIGEKGTNTNDGLGNVSYYENIGSVGNPNFSNGELDGNNTPTFGYINTKLITESAGDSAPVPFTVGDELYVLCGTNTGYLQLYACDSEDPNETCDVIDLQFGKIFEGQGTSIDLEDIDDDGYLEVAVGNKRGGIAIYNTIINIDGTISKTDDISNLEGSIQLYPNPATDNVSIESSHELSEFYLSNIFGQIISEGKVVNNQIDLSGLSQGVYFVSFKVGNEIAVKKVMKN